MKLPRKKNVRNRERLRSSKAYRGITRKRRHDGVSAPSYGR
jgi:hypothetical protein